MKWQLTESGELSAGMTDVRSRAVFRVRAAKELQWQLGRCRHESKGDRIRDGWTYS